MMVHRQCQSSGLVSQHQHDFKTLLKVLEIWPESWLDSLAVSWCCANGAHSTAAFGHWTEVIARRLCTWPLKWSHLSYVSVANLRSYSCSSSLSRLLSNPLPLEFIRVCPALHATIEHWWMFLYQSAGGLGHNALARHGSCLARAAANWFSSA